nr:pentatricopeptide repeat-containing protein At3g49740 [Ipomoea trifida]
MGIPQNLRDHLIKLNCLLADFTHCRQFYSALRLFHHIHSSHLLRPDHYTLSAALTACANIQHTLVFGAQLHAFGFRAGLTAFSHVSNALLSFYAKSQDLCGVKRLFTEIQSPDVYSWTTLLSACTKLGEVEYALQVFDEMPRRDVAVWNAIITGCAENGDDEVALNLFQKMHSLGVSHDNYTFASVLSLCSLELWGLGRQVHSMVVKTGFLATTSVINALVTMYFNCKSVVDASWVFEDADDEVVDQITYNAMIAGLVSMERNEEALVMFNHMRNIYLMPTGLTFVSLMSSCFDAMTATQIHALVVKQGFEVCTSVSNAAMTMYSNCQDLKATCLIFERIKEKDIVSWNAMITSYAQENLSGEAILAYLEMQREGVVADKFTLGSLLSSSQSVADAEMILSIVIKNGLILKIEVSNALVSAFCKLGEIEQAYRYFRDMFTRNLISWNAIISGCQSNGFPVQSLNLFSELLAEGLTPNAYTLSTVLSACASIPSFQHGKQIHGYILKFGLFLETSIGNTLIALYSKCGILHWSTRVFQIMTERDVVSWNSMISAYAQHGKGREAVHCFEKMVDSGRVEPDKATFTGLLSACSHAGLVEDGIQIFNSMVNNYGIKPGVEHFSCIVDILSRAGYLDEAEEIVKAKDIEVDSTVWWTLFSSCAAHGDTRLGRIVAGILLESEKNNPAVYVLLSNIYADAGKWEESASVRELMQRYRVIKQPGSSWVRS